ncbi:hypothetical protein SacglDRAFT_01534 [Saccharomonospora glauca K62]|uniref:Uncharacterized protein n=1 Tax=Saccharomonospora glauca K62 TaxID=928724 RepID=I1D0I0_9PSEU|nr:hypothetical protein SacglDRAFT_01534 [Saccharomonospora glauca K62]
MSMGLRGWWHRFQDYESPGSESQDHVQVSIQLASVDDSLYFTAEIAFWAWWNGGGRMPDRESVWDIARSGITRRAEEVSTRHRLTATERVRAELNEALLAWKPVGGSYVRARGRCLAVTADPELVEAVAAHERSKSQQLMISWSEQRRQQQREQMSSLLLDPLRATAWWLLNNQEKATEVKEVATTFLELQGMLKPAARTESAGKLVDEFLDTKDAAIKVHFLHTLKKCFLGYDREDLATRLSALEE